MDLEDAIERILTSEGFRKRSILYAYAQKTSKQSKTRSFMCRLSV